MPILPKETLIDLLEGRHLFADTELIEKAVGIVYGGTAQPRVLEEKERGSFASAGCDISHGSLERYHAQCGTVTDALGMLPMFGSRFCKEIERQCRVYWENRVPSLRVALPQLHVSLIYVGSLRTDLKDEQGARA